MGCEVGSKDVMSTVNPGVINNLVGGFNPSEKIFWSIGIIIPNIWKNNTCSKPPTSKPWFLKLWGNPPNGKNLLLDG